MTRIWVSDPLLPAFDLTTLPLPAEDDGELIATVLRKTCEANTRRALLYVHGYVDYFFHEHVATGVNNGRFNFYAIELHRYGRSLRPGNRPNYCTGLDQYFDEISQAIAIALEDGNESVVLYGHSTGGLIASLYAHRGELRDKLSAVVLNSPFFEFAIPVLERAKLSLAVMIGRYAPWMNDPKGLPPQYGQSIHKSERGEWDYELHWKPIRGFPTYFGWARAISQGHREVQRGLSIKVPVLVLHSDASGGGRKWSDEYFRRDIVLNVADMRAYSDKLGNSVKRVEIPGAIHDIMLSRAPVREDALRRMTEWIARTVPTEGIVGSTAGSTSTPTFA